MKTPSLITPLLRTLADSIVSGTRHDVYQLYREAAKQSPRQRNPVIVIPGILGSRLTQPSTGLSLWGDFSAAHANPRTPEGACAISMPMMEEHPLCELDDDVKADSVLERLKSKLFGMPFSPAAYQEILQVLGAAGFRDPSIEDRLPLNYGPYIFSTCFQFAYDWRRDVAENAAKLARFVDIVTWYASKEAGMESGMKVDIVAHSMGGLLLRYYLRYGDKPLPEDGSLPELTWEGAEHVENAVIIGTPNAGSAMAIKKLVGGLSAHGAIPKYPPQILDTMPAIYQLLPRGRHETVVDLTTNKPVESLTDPDLWERMGWGLAAPNADEVLKWLLPDMGSAADRKRIALDHMRKCLVQADRLHAALDRPAEPPETVALHLFAGDAVPTASVMGAVPNNPKLKTLVKEPGDGTVLRTSALMDERQGRGWVPRVRSPIGWHSVTFLHSKHMDLTRSPTFIDNLLYLLLERPRHPMGCPEAVECDDPLAYQHRPARSAPVIGPNGEVPTQRPE